MAVLATRRLESNNWAAKTSRNYQSKSSTTKIHVKKSISLKLRRRRISPKFVRKCPNRRAGVRLPNERSRAATKQEMRLECCFCEFIHFLYLLIYSLASFYIIYSFLTDIGYLYVNSRFDIQKMIANYGSSVHKLKSRQTFCSRRCMVKKTVYFNIFYSQQLPPIYINHVPRAMQAHKNLLYDRSICLIGIANPSI